MKAKICLIAPYKQLKHTASQVIRAMKADTNPAPDIKVVCCPIQKSVALAKELKAQGVQIIITRGGTATAIRKLVDIPLVEIQITGFDVMRAISPYRKTTDTIGIIGFENVVRGCQLTCSFWGIPTQEFIIDGNRYDVDWEAIRVQAQNMIDRHKISLVIGDNVVSRLNLQARHIRDDQENHSPCFT
jgi:hypothetical protein